MYLNEAFTPALNAIAARPIPVFRVSALAISGTGRNMEITLRRGLLGKAAFHSSGKPRGGVRAVLLGDDRIARPALRRLVRKKNGTPRPAFRDWLSPRQTDRITPVEDQPAKPDPVAPPEPDLRNVRDVLQSRWPGLRPLATVAETSEVRRVNVVTDGIGPTSLYGGVGTALILASLWAARSRACGSSHEPGRRRLPRWPRSSRPTACPSTEGWNSTTVRISGGRNRPWAPATCPCRPPDGPPAAC